MSGCIVCLLFGLKKKIEIVIRCEYEKHNRNKYVLRFPHK